jgi:thioredoxin-like negative regulator of GroEL
VFVCFNGHRLYSPAKLKHYICMVDFLGHAGHLQEAENLVMAMPCKQQVAAWMALLGACRIHGNVEMAEHIAKQILEMEPENAAAYVLLSSIYAAAGNRHLHTSIVFRYIAQVRTGSRYARMYVFN